MKDLNNDFNNDLNDEYSAVYNSKRIVEDRLERRKKKKRNNTIASILLIFFCVLVLVIVTYVSGILYMWIDKEFQKSANDIAAAVEQSEKEEVVTMIYTQEELDAKVAEAVAAATETAREKTSEEILGGIKATLSGGDTTMVETLRPYYEDELVVVSNGKFNFVPVRKELKMHDHLQENLQILESGEYQYVEDGQVISHKGIDVSKFQGEIDWEAVAADGVEFAFIRVGNRGYGSEGRLVEDERFEENVEGALKAGIKVGVYFYSQAITEEELLEEANLVLKKIAPYKIECPVVYDVEKVSSAGGRMNALSAEERTRFTGLFCDTIAAAGYKPMIYYNMEMAALMLNIEELENYDKWFAYYNPDFYYPYDYKIWQYTHNGHVNGIAGEVDMNISFAPVWE